MDQQEEEKVCAICQFLKPFGEFYSNSTTKDKLSTWCKDCHKNNSKSIYELNKLKKIEQVRERRNRMVADKKEKEREAKKIYNSLPRTRLMSRYYVLTHQYLGKKKAEAFCQDNGVVLDQYGISWGIDKHCKIYMIE